MTLARAALLRATAPRSFSTATLQTGKKEVPVPSGDWPIVGHLPRIIESGDGSKAWKDMHDECGDIFVCTVMGKKIYNTRVTDHARQILMNQGKYPVRTNPTAWKKIFDKEGWPWGIPFAEGENWKRRRKVLAENFLKPQNARNFVPAVLPPANRLVDCLESYVNPETNKLEGTTIRELTGMFALEAVMKVTTGLDFLALSKPYERDALTFLRGVEDIFTQTSIVDNNPIHSYFETKPYQRLTEAWRTLYRYPSESLHKVIDYYNEHGELPESSKGTVIPQLIEEYENGQLTMDEITGIASQGIGAAVDTTSQTLEYLLYNLARNPDAQDKLVEEIVAVTGKDGDLNMTVEEYTSLRYMVAVVKESMRLTPTIGSHARTLVQDAELGDYVIPEGELVLINYLAMSKNPEIYPEPEKFLPERFLKAGDTVPETQAAATGCPFAAGRAKAIQNGNAVVKEKIAAIPFGHGARKCTGKAFAELDMHLALASILRRYRVEYNGPELEQVEKQLLRPVEPIDQHFDFVPREFA